jgi:hypothetical protein
MVLYMGVYLYSVCGHLTQAQILCKRLFEEIIKERADICLPVYLILIVRIKKSQGEWKQNISYISRALAAAWVHSL